MYVRRNIKTRTTIYEDESIDEIVLYLDEAPVEDFDYIDNNEEFLHEGIYIPEDYDDSVNLPGPECDDEGNIVEPIFEDYIECNPYDSMPVDECQSADDKDEHNTEDDDDDW